MLQAGQTAPLFTLPDTDMDVFDLASMRDAWHVVLFFYPRDNSPMCVHEAAEFSDREQEFARHRCVPLGISRDDAQSHARFRENHGLAVRLLSDTDARVSQAYDVCHLKEVDGVQKLCVIRSTFIIDKQGKIRHALYDVSPRGHAFEVFQLVKELDSKCKSQKTRLSRSITA